jgi:tetratricopeptide (TPR) repeat protein
VDAEALRLAGRWDEAAALVRRGLERAWSPEREASLLLQLARILADRDMLCGGESEELAPAVDRAEELARAAGDDRLLAGALTRRGLALHGRFLQERGEEPPGELAAFEEALELRRRCRDRAGEAESLFDVGLVHQVVRGDSPASEPWFRESYELARELGDRLLMSYSIRHLGFDHWEAERWAEAEAALVESLRLREEVGWIPGIGAALLALGELARERGRQEEALAHLARARDTFASIGAGRYLAFAEAELRKTESS